MLIDSHCHLDYYTTAERPDVLARAKAAGVGGMVTIGTRLSRAAEQVALTTAVPGLWCTVGTHPHHAAEEALPQEQQLADLAAHPNVIGIGETGLDYFYDRAPHDAQAEVFRRQIRAARFEHSQHGDDEVLRAFEMNADEPVGPDTEGA